MFKRVISYEDFIEDLPNLHTWDNGITWNTGGFNKDQFMELHKIFSQLPKKPIMLETGAGCSTIAMLLANPAKVISIAPDRALRDRIVRYCKERNISRRRLDFHVCESEWILPMMALKAMRRKPFLDFSLIDGCHGWPTTFIDLQYVNAMSKQGSFIVIDDVQLHSVKEMARFIEDQPGFSLVLDIVKSRVYKKTSDQRSFGDFGNQPYILGKNKEYSSWDNPYSLEKGL